MSVLDGEIGECGLEAFTSRKGLYVVAIANFCRRKKASAIFLFATALHSGMYSFFQSLMDLRAKGHSRLSRTHSWWL